MFGLKREFATLIPLNGHGRTDQVRIIFPFFTLLI